MSRLMDILQERYLKLAERELRFSPQKSEYYQIKVQKGIPTLVETGPEFCETADGLPPAPSKSTQSCIAQDERLPGDSVLRCVLQCTRPQHISGRPDSLPFWNAADARRLFSQLSLPSSYWQIADGSSGSAQSHIVRDQRVEACRFEMIAHCISKQGDWAIALSHNVEARQTSVFWSVDSRIDSDALLTDLNDFQHCAAHPMLVPCIMFAANLRSNEQRRQSLKERMQRLEDAVRRFGARASFEANSELRLLDGQKQPNDLEAVFEMLHSCRKDQSSRKGRHEFWHKCHEAIDEGFVYVDRLMEKAPDHHLQKAHEELRQWKTVTFCKLQSLLARDKDQNHRVDTVSNMLYSLVQQRDIRLQSHIARAAQRDSEDMKFLTILGSIFLPASLIATILNVPAFQFADGGALFGAYIGITVPFSAIVLVLCFTRSRLRRWLALLAMRDKRRAEKAEWPAESLS